MTQYSSLQHLLRSIARLQTTYHFDILPIESKPLITPISESNIYGMFW